jgi:16S rRNA (cytidine1402-2'-O)-methyltransferase
MKSYASESVCAKVTAALSEGIDVAIVSDAGTPGIADPGAEIVRVVRHQCPAVPIVPVAGASAIAAAISVSGFPADQYYFAGFPPHKKGRQTFFAEIALRPEMVVMFESPHRIDKALESIAHSVPEREICLCRELTKRFESIHWGVADYHRERIRADAHNAKGEFVVILAPVSR